MRKSRSSFSSDTLSQVHGDQDRLLPRLSQGASVDDMRHDGSWDVAAEEQSVPISPAPSQPSSTTSASSGTFTTERSRAASASGSSGRRRGPSAASSLPRLNADAPPFIADPTGLPTRMQKDTSTVWSLDVVPQSAQGYSSATSLIGDAKKSALVHYEPIRDDMRVEAASWTLSESSVLPTETAPSSATSQCQEAVSSWSLDAPINPVADFSSTAAYQALPTESPAPNGQSTRPPAISKPREDADDDLRMVSWNTMEPPTHQPAIPPSMQSPSLSGISALLPSTFVDASEPLLQQSSILCLCEVKGWRC